MKGDNHLLAVTTKTVTHEQDPSLAEGETRIEPLYAFPVQICKATQDAKSPFDIAAPSGAERKQAFIDTATGEIVDDDACLRGIRLGEKFVSIDPEALAQVKGQKTNMIVAAGKVPLASLDFSRACGRYFVQTPSKGGSAKAYRLTYESLLAQKDAKGKVVRGAQAIVTKRTPRTNEKLCVIYADEEHGCLMLVQMYFADALREPDEQVLAAKTAEVTDKQIAMAVKVIDALPDGEEFLATAKDENLEAARALAEKAAMGEPITAPTPVAVEVEADDLESMLEASLSA